MTSRSVAYVVYSGEQATVEEINEIASKFPEGTQILEVGEIDTVKLEEVRSLFVVGKKNFSEVSGSCRSKIAAKFAIFFDRNNAKSKNCFTLWINPARGDYPSSFGITNSINESKAVLEKVAEVLGGKVETTTKQIVNQTTGELRDIEHYTVRISRSSSVADEESPL